MPGDSGGWLLGLGVGSTDGPLYLHAFTMFLDGLSSQVTQRVTELDHGSLSVVGFFLLQSTLTILTSDDRQC